MTLPCIYNRRVCYYRRFTDMFRILQYYGYLTDMTLDEYIDNAIQAG